MASIIIHIDTASTSRVKEIREAIDALLGLIPESSVMRSNTWAPENLTDAAFDGRLDDVLDYVKVLSDYGPNNAVTQPASL